MEPLEMLGMAFSAEAEGQVAWYTENCFFWNPKACCQLGSLL
jgi:hypothetical protein